jgi:hypothetical protein
MYIGLHVKYTLFLFDLNETCIFLERFSINVQILNFMKIPSNWSRVPCRRRDGGTDRRTNMTKLIVALRNFANAPKNHSHSVSGRKSKEETLNF